MPLKSKPKEGECVSRIFEMAFRIGAHLDSTFSRAFRNADDSMRNSEENANRFGASLGKLGSIVGGLAAVVGVGGIFAGAFSAADEFQAAMKQVQSATGTTIADMEEIKATAKNLYNQNLGENWEDVAKAISVAKNVTKQHGQQLEQTTKNAMIMRDVFEFDVAESVKTADTMMKNFGITSTDAYNLLAQGAQKGLDKSGELLDSANEYSPYFKSLGFTANEMFDTFSAGLESGAFNLDKVGDAVKEFNIRAKDGSKTSAEAFTALGMDAEKMSQTFAKGGPEAQKAFKTVVQAISAVKDPVKQNAIAVGLFGTQAEDLEKNVIAAMGVARNQFDMTKKTMEEIGKVKYDTVGKAFEGIGRKIQTGFLIPIGDAILPIFQKISDGLNDFIPAVQSAFANVTKYFKSFGSVLEGFAPQFDRLKAMASKLFTPLTLDANTATTILNILRNVVFPGIVSAFLLVSEGALNVGKVVVETANWFKANWEWIGPFLIGLSAAWGAYGAKLLLVSTYTKAVTLATRAWSIAQAALNVIMNLNPIGLIITGIGLLIGAGVLLVQNWDTVSQFFSDSWVKISNFFKSGANEIIVAVNKIIQGINDLTGTSIPKLSEFQIDTSVQVRQMQETKMARNMGIDGSHYNGLNYVPYDGYVGLLHKGERVLTARENKEYSDVGKLRPVASMGSATQSSRMLSIQNSPQIIVQGGNGSNVEEQVSRGLKAGNDDLMNRLRELEAQERRLSFG